MGGGGKKRITVGVSASKKIYQGFIEERKRKERRGSILVLNMIHKDCIKDDNGEGRKVEMKGVDWRHTVSLDLLLVVGYVIGVV